MWPFNRKQKRIDEAFRQAADRCLPWGNFFKSPMRFCTDEDGVYIVTAHLQGLLVLVHRTASGDMRHLTATNAHYTIAYGISPVRITRRRAAGYTLGSPIEVLSRSDANRFLETLTVFFNEMPDFNRAVRNANDQCA